MEVSVTVPDRPGRFGTGRGQKCGGGGPSGETSLLESRAGREAGEAGRRASCPGSLRGNHQSGKVGASLPVTAPVQSSPKHFFVLSPRWHMHESSDTLLWVAASSWHKKSPGIGSCWEPRADTLVKQKPPECWQDVLDFQCPPGERLFLALEALPERLSGPGGSWGGHVMTASLAAPLRPCRESSAALNSPSSIGVFPADYKHAEGRAHGTPSYGAPQHPAGAQARGPRSEPLSYMTDI